MSQEFVNRQNIQWFPGHMAKTLRLMEADIRNVDAVLQLLEYYEHGINDTNRTVYLQTFLISKGTLSYANHSKCK